MCPACPFRLFIIFQISFMKRSPLLLFCWLCSAVSLFSQGKAQSFPEFIYLDEKESLTEKNMLFQKYYQTDAFNELKPLKSEQDALGMKHEKFQQYYKGVKVDLATSTLHSKNGVASLITGNYQRISGLEVQPQISDAQGLQAAIAVVGAQHYKWEEPLSEREIEVLGCMALGLSNSQIAARLVVAPNTIKKHVGNIFAKLNVTSRVAAVEKGRQKNLIS